METLSQYSVRTEVSEGSTDIPRDMPGKQLNNNAATSICLGATEIILRTFCTVSNKLSSYTVTLAIAAMGFMQNSDCRAQ